MSQCSECLEQREFSSPRANSKERESSHKDSNTFAMTIHCSTLHTEGKRNPRKKLILGTLVLYIWQSKS